MLYKLFFSENSLLSIPSRTISSLKKLETLLVNNNLITTIKTDSFKDLTIQKIEVLFHSLTDTGEDSRFVRRQKRPKVKTLFFTFFSDASVNVRLNFISALSQ